MAYAKQSQKITTTKTTRRLPEKAQLLKSTKKRRVKKKRKFKPDDIRKKIKARFHKALKNCNFTARQQEILDLRRKGESIVSISMKLYLSERTINREIKRIKNKSILIHIYPIPLKD